MGHGVNAPHRRSDAQDDLEGVPCESMDSGFLGERESEDRVSPVLVIWERRLKMTWAMLVPRKGTEFQGIAKRAAKFIDQLGHNRVKLRCDSEPAIEALAREIAQARQEGSQTVPERPPVGESRSDGIIERAVELVASQARTLKAAPEHRIGARVPPDARILCWLLEFAAYLMDRCDIGSDGKTPLQRLHGRKANTPILEFGERILLYARQTSERRKVGAAAPPRSVCWHAEHIVRGSGCHRARTGDQDKVGEHQESARVGEMGRWQNTRDGSHSLVPRWQ